MLFTQVNPHYDCDALPPSSAAAGQAATAGSLKRAPGWEPSHKAGAIGGVVPTAPTPGLEPIREAAPSGTAPRPAAPAATLELTGSAGRAHTHKVVPAPADGANWADDETAGWRSDPTADCEGGRPARTGGDPCGRPHEGGKGSGVAQLANWSWWGFR